jgi:hypothetical protein
LPVFKVTVDGVPLGLKKEGPLTLEAGPRTIQYSNEDGSDIGLKHSVQIVAGSSVPDPFNLKSPAEAHKAADDAAKKDGDPQRQTQAQAQAEQQRQAQAQAEQQRQAQAQAQAEQQRQAQAQTQAEQQRQAQAQAQAEQQRQAQAQAQAEQQRQAQAQAEQQRQAQAQAEQQRLAQAQAQAEKNGIQEAVSHFQANPTTVKVFADAINRGGKLVTFAVNCDDQPLINADGNTATQRCHEKSQWDGRPQTNTPFNYIFAKTAPGKWVLKDRNPLK